jgi:hypothetical protein
VKNTYNILVGITEWKKPLGRTSVDGKIMLEGILRNQGGKLTGLIWLKIESSGGPL